MRKPQFPTTLFLQSLQFNQNFLAQPKEHLSLSCSHHAKFVQSRQTVAVVGVSVGCRRVVPLSVLVIVLFRPAAPRQSKGAAEDNEKLIVIPGLDCWS